VEDFEDLLKLLREAPGVAGRAAPGTCSPMRCSTCPGWCGSSRGGLPS